ncbi:hypothetical protein D8M04_02025 [Oceanobacillus piezotolerans]|uniref:Sodium:proton antiporter n=1 Tax=Oceanobacillus piezotolerans TaxID=2448030 RepID=A0A498DAD0_9BACI|nr:hypothetical protein D8M04_02025 [Oceanobacillus piezotolerans]
MRVLSYFVIIFTLISVLFKWRYRILNTILAVGFFRKVAVRFSMNIPQLRNQLIPGLFGDKLKDYQN